MRWTIILILAGCLQGCLVYSERPLTDLAQQPVDPAVLGTWYWNSESDHGYLHFGKNGNREQLRVVMVEIDRDGDMDVSEFVGGTSSVAGKTYLNLRWIRPEENNDAALFPEMNFLNKLVLPAKSMPEN